MIARKSMMSKKRKKSGGKDSQSQSANVFFDEDLDPVEVDMVPDDQLTLNDAELEEEFTKTLTSLDPNKAAKITHFNFKNGAFESRTNDKHMAFHVATEGVIWSTKERAEREKLRRERADKERQSQNVGDDEKEKDGATDDPQDDGTKDDDEKAGDGVDDEEEAEEELGTKSLVKNQFNY